MANDGVPIDGNWRELARQVQQENAPNKILDLVQQLITKFDEEKSRKKFPPTRVRSDRLSRLDVESMSYHFLLQVILDSMS